MTKMRFPGPLDCKMIFRALSLVLTVLLHAGCTTGIVPATGENRFLGYTWQEETAIGKQSSKQITALFGLYRDPQLERYVTEVGNRVLATSHLRRPGTAEEFRNTPVTFTILDSPIINAMALPGGYIYVTRGMLAYLNNEDQLASVLAHEIGHVAARHAARQAWQQQIGQGLLLGGMDDPEGQSSGFCDADRSLQRAFCITEAGWSRPGWD